MTTAYEDLLQRARERVADRRNELQGADDHQLLGELMAALQVAILTGDMTHAAVGLLVAEALAARATVAEVLIRRLDGAEAMQRETLRACVAALSDLAQLCARTCVSDADLLALRDCLARHCAIMRLLPKPNREKGGMVQ